MKQSILMADGNDFKSFSYKSKLIGTTVSDGDIGVLRNRAIAIPFKYLSNFWRSLEMSLINSKLN